MAESILQSVKQALGVDPACASFDSEITLAINTSIFELTQIGVGPTEGFVVKDPTQTWKSFIGDRTDIEAVKTYVTMKTRLIFDPPQSSFVIESMKNVLSELQWRLSIVASNKT